MTYRGDAEEDVSGWPVNAARSIVFGLDVAFSSTGDHSALCIGGVWAEGARSILGVREIIQFPRGTTADELADTVMKKAMGYGNPRIVVDVSNNQSFLSTLAARFPKRAANILMGAQITNSFDHASQPVAHEISPLGLRTVVPKIVLSKRCLVEDLSCELDAKTLRLTQTGNWLELKDELMSMERVVKAASVTYSAPSGKFDDLVMALSLCVYGLRKFGERQRCRGSTVTMIERQTVGAETKARRTARPRSRLSWSGRVSDWRFSPP